MQILRQGTAATVVIGPFIDDTDGKTAETGLTISQADVRLAKDGGDMAQKSETSNATHDELGYYAVSLDTDDTDTAGRLQLMVSKSGALPVWASFEVMAAEAYDTLFGTDNFTADLTAAAVDALWDELLSGHTDAGSAGERLGQTAAIVSTADVQVLSIVNGDTVTVYRGDTWAFDIESLPDLDDYETVALIVKAAADGADNDAQLILRTDDDLVRVGGAAATGSTNGSLTPSGPTLSVEVLPVETINTAAGTYGWAVVVFDTTPDPDIKQTVATGTWVIKGAWLESVTA